MTLERSPIRAGSLVEVWNRPLGGFRGRYCVTEVRPAGIRVQPVTEPVPLATAFSADELRLLPTPKVSATD